MNSSLKKRIVALSAVLAIALQSTEFAAFAAYDPAEAWNYASVAVSDAAAKPTVSKKTGLEVGQTVQGFTVKEIKGYKYLNADIILLEHDKTGAKLMYIANDDTERAFSLAFRTIADDETGKPHVFEHSTLNGSDKYPANAWFNIKYQTYNTFMNAFTYQNQTIYPLSSLSEKQLLKYADYYTDACFHPLIMKDENIFKQEAWRYRLEKTSGELTIEGTVYSEMLAASDINNNAYLSNLRTAFPGSTISNEPGGAPDHIPELTYEEIKAYHNKYYHPSNCVATLYGKIDNFESFAKLLNKEFSKYKKENFTFDDVNYKPIKGPVTNYEAFPASNDEDTKNQSIVSRDYILRDISDADLKKAYLIGWVLNDENSPLITTIKKKYPQAQISISVNVEGPEYMLEVDVKNVEKSDASRITAIIDSSLKKIAKEGIDEKILERIIHNLEAGKLLSGEGTTMGVNYAQSIGYYYAATGDIWFARDVDYAADNILKYSKAGDFRRILSKYVTNNKLRVLNVTYPEKGLLEKQEAERKKKLADKKASMSKAELEQLVKETKEFDSRIDADDEAKAEIVARVNGVTLASLPEDVPDIKAEVTVNDKNVRTITAEAEIKGIGIAETALDISDLTIEEAMWTKLYTSMMFEADTSEHKASEMKALRDMSLISFSSGIDVCLNKDNTEFRPCIAASWYVFDEDMESAFDVFNEALTKTKTNQRSKIKGAAESARNSIKEEILDSGRNMVSRGGLSTECGYENYLFRVNYLEYYDFLGDVLKKLESDPAYVIKNLNNAKKKLANSYGATFGYAGSRKGISAFKKYSAAFADSLGNSPKKKAEFERSSLADAYSVNCGANYNYMFMSFADMGMEELTPEEQAEFEVVSYILSDAYMLPYLRNYYGAYGAYASNNSRGIIFDTYRDPNIAESYTVYAGLADYLDSFEIDQETLDGYIMSSYSFIVQSQGNLTDAFTAVLAAFDERDHYAEVSASLKTLKKMTPERVNEIKTYYARTAREGKICTVGTPASVKANKKYFKKIVAPFSE